MVYALILSGGVGSRMQSKNLPKQYIEVGGKPVLMYTLMPFDESKKIDHIVIVASPEWHDQIRQWVQLYQIQKPVTLAANGENRQDSVFSGLRACNAIQPAVQGDKVIIHDAVRPLVDTRIIADCVDILDHCDCCLTAVPDYDTTFKSLDAKTIHSRVNREELVLGQTPEGFSLPMYLALNENATKEELATLHGSSELPFLKGYPVHLVTGSALNFKLTRPDDITLFKALVNAK